MNLEEITVRNTKTLDIGWLIKITKDRTGHEFEKGALMRVGRIVNEKRIHPASQSDERNVSGCTVDIDEFVVIQEKSKGLIGGYKEINLDHLDKVVLPKGHKQAILETLVQESADNKKILFDDWGFKDHFEKGRGVVFMFYGIPGTGKTMCAELMAKALHRKFIMLTTAEVQSSVPGQAERNIKDAFSTAKSKNLLMIIDECDALIYSRNSVGAIMAAEINCLLSEVERFDGVTILTTNRNQKLDPALERRIALKLEFPKPNKKIRKKIWKKLIPEKCPIGKCVSIDKLASHDLCGGNIKNVIFASARRALYHKKDKVTMSDFKEALKRELQGKVAFVHTGEKEIKTSKSRGMFNISKTIRS